MSALAGVKTLAVGMFLTGCATSLLSKYQDKECVENCGPDSIGPRVNFEQPVWQTFSMFIGESFCCLPLVYTYFTSMARNTATTSQASVLTHILACLPLGTAPKYAPISASDDSEGEDDAVAVELRAPLRGWRVCWMWFPAFLDICGTTLLNAGLILTPVSIFQMSRGALVLWVGVLSVMFLGRRLWLYQWVSLVIVTFGVCLVGLSGSLVTKAEESGLVETVFDIARRADGDPAKVALGVILILLSGIFTACQYVIEEKIMSRYKVEPAAAVSLEGFFGMVTTLLAMLLVQTFFRNQSPYFDIPRGWHQIISSPAVTWSCLAFMASVGVYNFFGLSMTSRVSATTRSTIDTCRTLGIWIVSVGLGWERLVWPSSILQLVGFGMLVYGTFVFNGLIAPMFCPPPPAVHLPHEPVLEETGEEPAAAAHGRAGYDVIPTEEEDRT